MADAGFHPKWITISNSSFSHPTPFLQASEVRPADFFPGRALQNPASQPVQQGGSGRAL